MTILPVPWPLHGALGSIRKSRWFCAFGGATYAKTTLAAEIAGWSGQLGGLDRGEGIGPAKRQEMKLTGKHN